MQISRLLRNFSNALMIVKSGGLSSFLKRLWKKSSPPRDRIQHLQPSEITENFYPLDFQNHESPLVSIIVSLSNHPRYSFHCLKTILSTTADSSSEIIIVAHQADTKTREMLKLIKGITVIHDEDTQVRPGPYKTGFQLARGRFVVLLQDTTEPCKDWLEALLHTFQHYPDAALVGARLISTNGRLLEAGGIVWPDASITHYGINDDPDHPKYSYCRAVDFCTSSCVMLKADILEQLNIRDDISSKDCYGDLELAFTIKKAGHKIYYQPMASVFQLGEFSDQNNEVSLIEQRKNIFEKWSENLQEIDIQNKPQNLEKINPEAGIERNIKKRVLIIDAHILKPDHDSGSLRMFNLAKIFQKLGFKVSFASSQLEYHPKYTKAMQFIGIECLYHPYVSSINDHLQTFGHLYDVVLLSRADVAEKYIRLARQYCINAKLLFDTVDLHFLREKRQAALRNDKLAERSVHYRKQQELTIARQADITLVVSPVELDLLREIAPDIPVALLSNIHKLNVTNNPFDNRHHILFIGNFNHPPNCDAMDYFLNNIFPLLHTKKPEIQLLIIGNDLPEKIKKRASSNIIIKGFISDIEPIFNNIKLSIAPLRYGSGVKGKINSSMAFGVPVIATTVAAEGMGLSHEKDVMISDTAEGFCDAIIQVYEDETLWRNLVTGGLANIEQCFSFELVEKQLRDIIKGSL